MTAIKDDLQQQIDNYLKWLRDRTEINELDAGWCVITTPYLDHHNDALQIFVQKKPDGSYFLTDDGYVLNDLRESGCEVETQSRQQILAGVLNGFGIKLENGALTASASAHDFPRKKHRLVQTMLSAGDLFYLSSSRVLSVFTEDVKKWLDDADVRYNPKLRMIGQSGFDHVFDYAIPGCKKAKQRFLQVLATPDRNHIKNFLFSWIDTGSAREPDCQGFAIYNSEGTSISQTGLSAMEGAGIRAVPWEERKQIVDLLSA